ncbi:hypothetical protein EDD22DRAFT_959257 [Suillus occidentalis]|nr:hypothetical protein EDD22DRAFT_959257 [Suillus occidentalis]
MEVMNATSDPPKMMFNFQAGASHEANSAIFSQAADVVWKEQCLAEDHEKAVDEYITWHHIDPSELLQPEYMSDQISELDTDDEDKKKARKTDVQKAANLLEREVCAGVPVWETIRPAWGSEEAGGPHAPIAMYEQDPQGFKKPEGEHDEDLTEGNSERAHENSGTDSHSMNGTDGTENSLDSECHIPYINASHPDLRILDPVQSDAQIRFRSDI